MTTYIIKSQELFTIGKTKNLATRLKAYITHCPYFEIVKTFNGDYERALHRYFKEYRRGKEEWFFLTDELVNAIDISKFENRKIYDFQKNDFLIENSLLSFCKEIMDKNGEIDLSSKEGSNERMKIIQNLVAKNYLCKLANGKYTFTNRQNIQKLIDYNIIQLKQLIKLYEK